MKRMCVLILAFTMLCLAACGRNLKPVTEPTAEPTAKAAAEPVAEPNSEPTAEATYLPRSTEKPASYAFEDCAELVLTLPWGEGEKDVFLWEVEESCGPRYFYVTGDFVYIYDRWEIENSFLIYNMKTGELERIGFERSSTLITTEFAVMDGLIITPKLYVDIATGEVTKLSPIFADYFETNYSTQYLTVRDGKCYMYVSDQNESFGDFRGQKYVDEYELDFEGKYWKLVRPIVKKADDSTFVTEGGIEIDFGFYRGSDNEGCHWVVSDKGMKKFAADGTPIAFIERDYFKLPEYWENYDRGHNFRIAEDGSVYIMICAEECFKLCRIDV